MIGSSAAGWPYEMYRYHRPDRRQARRRVIQNRRQLDRIHRVVIGLDVDQHRRRADHLDRGDRRDGGMRNGHDTRARPDTERAQCERQRIGAVAAADRSSATQPCGEFGFERPNLLPEDVPAGLQRPRDGGVDRGLQCAVAGPGVRLRDSDFRCTHDCSLLLTVPPDGNCCGSIAM